MSVFARAREAEGRGLARRAAVSLLCSCSRRRVSHLSPRCVERLSLDRYISLEGRTDCVDGPSAAVALLLLISERASPSASRPQHGPRSRQSARATYTASPDRPHHGTSSNFAPAPPSLPLESPFREQAWLTFLPRRSRRARKLPRGLLRFLDIVQARADPESHFRRPQLARPDRLAVAPLCAHRPGAGRVLVARPRERSYSAVRPSRARRRPCPRPRRPLDHLVSLGRLRRERPGRLHRYVPPSLSPLTSTARAEPAVLRAARKVVRFFSPGGGRPSSLGTVQGEPEEESGAAPAASAQENVREVKGVVKLERESLEVRLLPPLAPRPRTRRGDEADVSLFLQEARSVGDDNNIVVRMPGAWIW